MDLEKFTREHNIEIGICNHEIGGAEKTVFVVCVPIPAFKYEADDGRPRGVIAAAMSGEDYHGRVREKLEALAGFLRGEFGDFAYGMQVDDGAVRERPLAVKSGVAFQGLNRCVYTESFGSYFNIGLLITELPVEAYAPSERYCARCGACKRACPTGALGDFDDENGGFWRERCIARITSRPGELSEAEAKILGDRVWGCDTCQAVCPLNSGHVIAGYNPALEELVDIDEETFLSRFPVMAWRSAKTLRRNARAALRNVTKERV